ncbi:sterile alpha motif domain-containing protein 9-like [Lampetra planeri]
MTATYQQRQSSFQVSLWLRAASPSTTYRACHRSSRRRRVAVWTPPPPRPVVEMELAGAGVDAGTMSDAARHEARAGCVFLLLPCGGVYTVEVNECDRVSDVVSRVNERHGPLVPSAATLHHQGRQLPPSTRLSTHGGLHEANLHVQYPLRGGSSPGHKGDDKNVKLPSSMQDWNEDHVRHWLVHEVKLKEQHANKLHEEELTGPSLVKLQREQLKEFGLKSLQISLLVDSRDEYLKSQPKSSSTHSHVATTPAHGDEALEKTQSHREKKGAQLSPGSAQAEFSNSEEKPPKKNKKRNQKGTKQQQEKCVDQKQAEPGDVVDGDDTNIAQQVHEEASQPPAEVGIQEHSAVDDSSQQTTSKSQVNICSPCPFDHHYTSHRYIRGSVLPSETGITNYIDPVHEFKLFACEGDVDEESKMKKFCNEVFRFSAGCMNRRTNGTIHFGVGDTKSEYRHGEVTGVHVEDQSKFVDTIDNNISKYFQKDRIEDAKECIRPPRFVEVISPEHTSLGAYVIEVDVISKSTICKDNVYEIKQMKYVNGKWQADKENHVYKRDGASSKDILATQNSEHWKEEYRRVCEDVKKWNEQRKLAETSYKIDRRTDDEGKKLTTLITGGKGTLDDSYYKKYILVVNKADQSQLPHLDFVKEINWFAVLDFDPESAISGLCSLVRAERSPNLHFPRQFVERENYDIEIIAKNLNLHKQTSWIFCNGRANIDDEKPMGSKEFQKKRSDNHSKLVSLLCNNDLMPSGRFLVVFLLLMNTDDPIDPMMETFFYFYQKLNGLSDMMLITERLESYESWATLAHTRVDEDELAYRSIRSMSLDHLNSTICKIKSATKSRKRFLRTSVGGSCSLTAVQEERMSSLTIVCENECEDTGIEADDTAFDELRRSIEENYYKGGKVCPWNFYFSEKRGKPFIKREPFNNLKENIEDALKSNRCLESVNLFHHPGCGGTTLAWHVLWELRKKFRCAVIKSNSDDQKEISVHVKELLKYAENDAKVYTPVLLLADDIDDTEILKKLQHSIISELSDVVFDRPLVVMVNCMRSQALEESQKNHLMTSVILEQKLSSTEQHLFEEKLKEIKNEYEKCNNFLSFMIIKENFDSNYIKNTVKNMLKGLDYSSNRPNAKLISYVALLNNYVKNTSIPVSRCEAILGISQVKSTFWRKETLEDGLSQHAKLLLIKCHMDEVNGTYESVRMIHPLVAKQVLEEFESTNRPSRFSIAKELLAEDIIFNNGMGREHLVKNVRNMFVIRHRKEQGDETDSLFAPLIEDIIKHKDSTLSHQSKLESGMQNAKELLLCATDRFSKDAILAQALARYCYLKDNNFDEAKKWAEHAKKLVKNSSYITDTIGQIYKHELKQKFDVSAIEKKGFLPPSDLNKALQLAKSASDFFREAQELVKTEDDAFNTAGFFGDIEVATHMLQLFELTKVFHKTGEIHKRTLVAYLNGRMDLSRLPTDDEEEKATVEVLQNNELYLRELKSRMKYSLEVLEAYFWLFKPRYAESQIQDKHRYTVEKFYNQYAKIFCSEKSEKLDAKQFPKISATNEIELKHGDRFPGLIRYLAERNAEKSLEVIISSYKSLLHDSKNINNIKGKQNCIFANVILNCVNNKSKTVSPYSELVTMLNNILREIGTQHRFPEPYFLALLLLWLNEESKRTDVNQLAEYIEAMKRSFRAKYVYMSRRQQLTTNFFLGKGKGLDRIVSRTKIDKTADMQRTGKSLRLLWLSGDIFKEKKVQQILLRLRGSTTDEGDIYLDHRFSSGDDKNKAIKIPVHPVNLGPLRTGKSIESVTFFVGFTMEGPIAYDIQPV